MTIELVKRSIEYLEKYHIMGVQITLTENGFHTFDFARHRDANRLFSQLKMEGFNVQLDPFVDGVQYYARVM